MKVHVLPRLAESVALAAGAALLNPVVGIATLAAQKVLRDPVGRILSVDYEVSGSLRDPRWCAPRSVRYSRTKGKTMKQKFLAAAVQMVSGSDVDANVRRAAHWVAEAAAKGARLVACPSIFA